MKKISLLLVIILLPCCFFALSCEKQVDKTYYEITCELENNTLKGREKVTFYNSSENAFSSLKFNLFANAFRRDASYKPIAEQYKYKAYYNGESYGDIVIDRVMNACEKDLEFSVSGVDKNILEVFLDGEVFPSESVSVVIEYTLTLAEVIARTGINSKTINLANFYPILCGIEDGAFYECVYYANGDPYFSDVSSYLVTLTHSENYVVASSGKAIKSEEKNGKKTTTYKLDNARDFAFILSSDFECVTEEKNGVEINYYFLCIHTQTHTYTLPSRHFT